MKHVVTVRRRSSSYATMFQTEAQQATPEGQQLVLVKRDLVKRVHSQEHIMVVLDCQERPPQCIPSLLLCSLTCRKLRRLQVAGARQARARAYQRLPGASSATLR